MRFNSAKALAALLLLTLACAHARAQTVQQQQEGRQEDQQQDEKVIEDFVTTRGVIFETPGAAKSKPAAQTRRRPGSASAAKSPGAKPSGVAASKKGAQADGAKQGGADSVDSAASDEPAGGVADGAQVIEASAPRRLALGYTLYMKDTTTGALFPVDASRPFKTDDTIALALETNADGYLYVFNAENDRDPMMLYPNVRLGGANSVSAPVRETYPDDPADGFQFVPPAATEHLYIVFSRRPLDDVPTGEALEKFCAKNRENCYWRPGAAQWARIKAAASDRRVVEARSTQLAQAAARPVAPDTLQRGIKIKRTEPRPAFVRVADSPAASMLVTKIELAHQ